MDEAPQATGAPARAAAARRRPPFVILMGITSAAPFALNVFMPSMPGLQEAFGAPFEVVQLTLTLYMVGFAVAQLAWGPLSDRFGRRPVLLVGLALYLAGSLACMLAPAVEVVVAGRCLQAAGGGAGMVLSRAIIRDLYDRSQSARMIAYVIMAMAVAPMLGPAVGGHLDEWFGWRAGFAFVSAYGLLLFVACAWLLHETHHGERLAPGMRALARTFGHLLRIRTFLGYAGQMSFTSGVFFSFLGGAPYVSIVLMGRPPREYGLFFMIVAGNYIFGNFLAGRLTLRLGIDRLIGLGTALSFAGASAFAGFHFAGVMTPWVLFGCMGAVACGNGMSMPNGMAGAVSVDPARSGAASGLAGFLQMTTGGVGSYLVGRFLVDSAAPLVAVMWTGTVLAILAHTWGVRLAPPPAGQGGARS